MKNLLPTFTEFGVLKFFETVKKKREKQKSTFDINVNVLLE